MTQKTQAIRPRRPWYKSCLGSFIAISFWPLFVPWYALTQSSWSRAIKIVAVGASVSVIFAAIFLTGQVAADVGGIAAFLILVLLALLVWGLIAPQSLKIINLKDFTRKRVLTVFGLSLAFLFSVFTVAAAKSPAVSSTITTKQIKPATAQKAPETPATSKPSETPAGDTKPTPAPTQPAPVALPAPTAPTPQISEFGERTKTSGCSINGALQDKACTPGAVFTDATKDKICVSGYSASVRDVSDATKNDVYSEYGITSHTTGQYEVDHLIPLEIGGSNDIANLWPEPASPTPGFHQKDTLENNLHSKVCSGALALDKAQQEIESDWLGVYTSITPTTSSPSSSNSSSSANSAPSTPSKPTSPPAQSGVVKMSTTHICHAPGTTYYERTTNFTPYPTLQACLDSGGRLPKK